MLLMGEDSEKAMGASAYQEVVSKEPASQNRQYVDLVNRVGQRIAAVAGKPEYQWEFRVIASPQQNAFCLPGGKVAVYEGIIPVCQNEAGLAVVMSHEIGHALARHGGERMSQGYAVDAAKQAISYVTQTQEQQKREAVMKAYGLASQYGVILPYSRKHESEADHIGLMLLAKAGYDPAEAPRFWQRFAAAQQGTKPAEWMSTHPSDNRRAEDLTKLLPEAQKLYAAAPVKYGLGEVLAAAPLAPAAPGAPVAPVAGWTTIAGPSGPAATGGAGTQSLQSLGGGAAPGASAPQVFPPPLRSSH
jgi:predicted Zn-dependent protease